MDGQERQTLSSPTVTEGAFSGVLRASDLAIKAGRDPHDLGTVVDPADGFRWMLLGGTATETQTLYACLDERDAEEILFWQVAHSNLGWGQSVMISGRYYKKGVCNIFRTVAVPNSSFKVSTDKRSVTAQGASLEASADGKSIKVLFDLPNGNGKEGTDLSFEIDLKVDGPGFTIGDGKNYLNAEQFISHQTLPCVTVAGGRLKAGGKNFPVNKGRAVFVHALIGAKPHKAASRWNFASFHAGPAASLLLLQFETPKLKTDSAIHVGGEIVAYGCLVMDGRIEAVTVDCEAVVHATILDPETGCNPPTDIEYVWSGTTCDGTRTFSASIRSSAEVLVDKVDVLTELPYLVRKAIQIFVTKPYYYIWSDRATAHLTIGGEERQFEGSLTHEYTFLN